MKLICSLVSFFCFIQSYATTKDSSINYNLPDSVNAVSFIADVSVSSFSKKEVSAGIKAKGLSLVLEAEKTKREISFEFPSSATIIATGVDVEKEKGELEWKFNWQLNTNYKLLIASAADSAENFVIYSGYIFLPEQQKWKLIGSCRVDQQREAIKDPASTSSRQMQSIINNVWIQRSAGSWKKLDEQSLTSTKPVINPMPAIDSVQQYKYDKKVIEKALNSKQTDVDQIIDGVYYKIINPGTGKSFTVSDSVTVKYQLRIFGTSEIISGNDTDTYTFPLKNLIKAWQVAVPLIKTGGKIKLVIPSGLGYSIRTRAPKIPPNSILEFFVEVIDAKTQPK